MQKHIMMYYRIADPQRRAANPEHRLSHWNYMLVSDKNSEMTDGETFDLIRTYRDDRNGTWEVVLQEVELPE